MYFRNLRGHLNPSVLQTRISYVLKIRSLSMRRCASLWSAYVVEHEVVVSVWAARMSLQGMPPLRDLKLTALRGSACEHRTSMYSLLSTSPCSTAFLEENKYALLRLGPRASLYSSCLVLPKS